MTILLFSIFFIALVCGQEQTRGTSVKNWLPGSKNRTEESSTSPVSKSNKKNTPKTQNQDDSEFFAADSNEDQKLKFKDFLELEEGNHIVLRGPVTEDSVTKLIVNITKIQHNDIVLFISSPGGSVIAGQNLIQQIKYLQLRGRKVYCVADMAASMAFGILQACDERYVTPSSILMQHQMSAGLSGQYFNIKSRLGLLDSLESAMTKTQSERMNLTEEEFTKKITSDWWLYGEQGVANNAADAMIHVGCHNDLLSQTSEETFYIHTFLGRIPIQVVFSCCPLAREPLEVKVKDYMDLDLFQQARLQSEIENHLGEMFNLAQLNF